MQTREEDDRLHKVYQANFGGAFGLDLLHLSPRSPGRTRRACTSGRFLDLQGPLVTAPGAVSPCGHARGARLYTHVCRGPLEQLPALRGIAYMGFSFIVASIVLVICSSYRIHVQWRAKRQPFYRKHHRSRSIHVSCVHDCFPPAGGRFSGSAGSSQLALALAVALAEAAQPQPK